MTHYKTLLFGLLAISLDSAGNEIYRYQDAQGRVTFSDRPLNDGYVPMQLTWKGWEETAPPTSLKAGQLKYRGLVAAAAKRQGLDDALLNAVIHAESHFNPVATSSKGAVGLMQLMPATATRFGVHNRKNPKQNIEGGSRYLKYLLTLFEGDMQLAVAAYNAGENAVIRRGNAIPPYPETQAYVKKVLRLYQEYNKRG